MLATLASVSRDIGGRFYFMVRKKKIVKLSIKDRLRLLEQKRKSLKLKYESELELIDNTIKYWKNKL